MMPRLRLAQHNRPGGQSWPSFDERQSTPLFLGRQQYRKLVVLLDADVLQGLDMSTSSKKYLLGGLLTLDVIECLRYADEGPPADVPRHEDRFMGEVVPGWVVLSPDDGLGYRSARTATGDEIGDYAVIGNAPDVAEHDTRTPAYGELAAADAAAQRRADVLAAMVANAIQVDLFITRRPYLHAMSWNAADGVTFADIDDALAVIGLYLRAQNQYVTSRNPQGGGSSTMNRGLFFWVGTRELLPSAWRWLSAFVQHSTRGGDDSLLYLGQSVLRRVERALQVRDEVHVRAQQTSEQRHCGRCTLIPGCRPPSPYGGGRCDCTGRPFRSGSDQSGVPCRMAANRLDHRGHRGRSAARGDLPAWN